jgi:hypothetical protein
MLKFKTTQEADRYFAKSGGAATVQEGAASKEGATGPRLTAKALAEHRALLERSKEINSGRPAVELRETFKSLGLSDPEAAIAADPQRDDNVLHAWMALGLTEAEARIAAKMD